MKIASIHHVSLTVTDLEHSRHFYSEILGLEETERPNFPTPGAWFRVGAHQQLHLLVSEDPTFRGPKPLDATDIHFAARAVSFSAARAFLYEKGFREDADPAAKNFMLARPHSAAGFPQIHILDPDWHVIEINADLLDAE